MKNLLLFILIITTPAIAFAQNINPMGTPIHVEGRTELQPYISLDGNSMVFIVLQNEIPSLYETKKNGNIWNEPVSVQAVNEFKQGAIIGAPSYNHDATIIYFHADFKKDSSGFDIYYTEKINNIWSKPKNLGPPINTINNEFDPSISANNLSMYFARTNTSTDNKDNQCNKLYESNRIANGPWQEPTLLPEPINADCEKTPRILSDNKTLLISSIRNNSDFGFDLYYCKKLAPGIWIAPIRIDTLASKQEESFPSCDYSASVVYFSKSEQKRKKTLGEIYFAELPAQFKPNQSVVLKGKITNLHTQQPIKATISIIDPSTSRIITSYSNNPFNGDYFIPLPIGSDYLIDFHAEGYSHCFERMTTNKFEEKNLNIQLFPNVHLLLNVFDNEIFEPQQTELFIKDSKSGKTINPTIETISKGRYKIEFEIGKKYSIDLNTKYFDPYHFIFDLTDKVQFNEFERDIELKSQKHKIDFKISDEQQNGVEVEVEITNLTTNEKYKTLIRTDENGIASVYVRKGDKYEVNINSKGYTFFHTDIDLVESPDIKTMEIKLKRLTEDTKLQLNDINFETNSADLTISSYNELERIVKLMETNPQIKIEISAHTDDRGSDVYNLKLSERRAQSVVNYLIDKNVPISKLIAKGYGKSTPLVPNNSDENRAKNRRVELKIIEII